MFTGIITDIGRVKRIRKGDLAELTIATRFDTAAIAIGASIACSGACLTVTAVEDGAFTVQASAETLARTTIGGWAEGTPVNLEQSLRLGDELGGHLVSGHVDGLARLVERRPEAHSVRFTFEAPEALMPFIAPKGSVSARRGQPDGQRGCRQTGSASTSSRTRWPAPVLARPSPGSG